MDCLVALRKIDAIKDPEKAKLCFQMALEVIEKQRKLIRCLQLKHRRVRRRAEQLKGVVEILREHDIDSEEGQHAIKKYKMITKVCSNSV